MWLVSIMNLPEAEKVLDLAVAGRDGDVLDVNGSVGSHGECVC
jgi:hypothetical protein